MALSREPGQIVTAAYLRDGRLRYAADDREIVGRNGGYFNNRPLYGPANAEGVALAGDRPFVRLLGKGCNHGAFAAGIVREGSGRWFHECAEVATRYRCGRMTWTISDPGLAGVTVTLTVVPLPAGAGFAACFAATGLRAGDRLVWTFGGARLEDNPRTRWDPVNRGNPQVHRGGEDVKPELLIGPVPEWSRGNAVRIEDPGFTVAATAASSAVSAHSDRAGVRTVADASAFSTPVSLAASTVADLPLACEVIDLRPASDEVFWTVSERGTGILPVSPSPAPPGAAAFPSDGSAAAEPSQAFAAAVTYLNSIERIRAETPDPFLDAAVAAVCHPVDGNCERDPFIFRHGCMSFSIRFLGWRVIHGATVLGWHDRVRGNAAYYAAAQLKESGGRTEPHSDPGVRLCHESQQSRLYGKGRIPIDQTLYDTQTQFFDQTIHDWRWTADPELEKILRPALELHLEWARECFDPDDDGLYESYINTLPTDCMWYNGGGGVEQSAYIYYGHRAAADLARRAGDADAAARHLARAEKIQRAVRAVLWLEDRGHFGVYVEQGGHRRVHADSWTYSQFMPIDAGFATPDEAIQSLYFTEWALERTRLPYGGVLCQQSNWVPSKWSVRDTFSGDLCHLALAYFQTGLGDEGWDILRGSTLETCYASAVPGGFSHIGAGTDFGDSAHMFPRVVAEGLFGYDPDYPNDVVRIHPAFPAAWAHAAFRSPDFTLEYRREGDVDSYRLDLARAATVEFRVAVRASGVKRVTLNGQEVPWKAEPGYGCTLIKVERVADSSLHLRVELAGRVDLAAAQNLEASVGDDVRLETGSPRGTGLQPGFDRTAGVAPARLRDFHHILENIRVSDRALTARLARKPGHHLILAGVTVGDLPQWRIFKLKVNDPAAEAAHAARTPRVAPREAAWACLDLAPHLNADVRAIFKQQYLSPRPKTCSVRLGVDGYSAWTFPHWREGPPEIGLERLDRLGSDPSRIATPQHAPFARFALEKNIAFTSLWDNWPRSVTIPVGMAADTAWLLVCGSTFPMQTRIANGVLRFRYADGQIETLDLVPPLNFWSLCPWGGLDYSYESDAFCLPLPPPPTVQLGAHCRAMVLSWRLRPGIALMDVTLEALSQDVVIGLMGVSLMLSAPAP